MLYDRFTIIDPEYVVDETGIKRRIGGVKISDSINSSRFYGPETTFCRTVCQVGTKSAGEIKSDNTVVLL